MNKDILFKQALKELDARNAAFDAELDRRIAQSGVPYDPQKIQRTLDHMKTHYKQEIDTIINQPCVLRI